MCNDDFWWRGKNPYTMDQEVPLNQVCGGGIVNITGNNMNGIMKVMKFAYHLADASDFKELNDKILKANYTYSLTSSTNVMLSGSNSLKCQN